jgi:hypothetical protein
VPDDALDRLRTAAEQAGAHVHFATGRDVVWLAVAAERATQVEMTEPDMRAAIDGWVHESARRDGVPVQSIGPSAARPVPIRPFVTPDHAGSDAAPGQPTIGDAQARYAVIFTDGDTPRDWLAAGEALSAVLLTATADGLATSVMSDLVEVPIARVQLRRILSNLGYPAVVVRVGRAAPRAAPPPAARRRGSDVVQIVAEPVETAGTAETRPT